MAGKAKTVWDRLLDVPQWGLAAAVLVCLIIPVIHPLGLPVPVGSAAREYFEWLKKIPAGANVMFFQEMSGSGWDEIKGGFVATMKYLWMKKVNVVIMPVYADAVPTTSWGIGYANPGRFGAIYGKDYVFLGYVPGDEIAIAAVRDSIRGAVSTDYAGTPLAKIPLLEKVDSYKDFSAIIVSFSSGTAMDKYVRQWHATHPEITQHWMTASGNEMSVVAWYIAGIAKGYLSGPTGCAGLENLIGEPGLAAAITDMKNLGSLPVLVLLILGNIAYFGKKMSKKE